MASLKPSLDVTTEEGRALIASTAYKIARTKTFADELGKKESDPLKAEAKRIDAERKTMCAEMDALKHETRAPLTEWEERTQKRAADFETKLGENIQFVFSSVGSPSVQAIQQWSGQASRVQRRSEDGMNTAREPAKHSLGLIPALKDLLVKAEREEADRAELEELRRLEGEVWPSRSPCSEKLSKWQRCQRRQRAGNGHPCQRGHRRHSQAFWLRH